VERTAGGRHGRSGKPALSVEEEIREARRYFSKQGWPVIDVTKRSIEETATTIMELLKRRNGGDADHAADDNVPGTAAS